MIKQKNPSGTYRPSYDRTPRYTVKQVAEMMECQPTPSGITKTPD